MLIRAITISAIACSWLLAVSAAAGRPAGEVQFSRDVLPILATHCFPCHGPDEAVRQAELRLDIPAGIFSDRPDGLSVIAPGKTAGSEMYQRITAPDVDRRMPPAEFERPLSEQQVETIRSWIESGANWSTHWAFEPLRPGPVPGRLRSELAANQVDHFIMERLQQAGLELSPGATRETLIRRLSLDLRGLPASPDEVDAFLLDERPDAYPRLVDRLLASNRYGERMALDWLDAARYADTHGYLFDTERSMWRWREWVINAFNQNMPFDQFTIEQLAGDLLPNATTEQRLATGFHRNHIINNEAGATPAEYLVENIVDRVNTTATVWLGLTINCCQCHDHKYDPVTQREYYQLYAYFNNIPELGLDGLNRNAAPFISVPTDGDRARVASLESKLAEVKTGLQSLDEQIAEGQGNWEANHESRPAVSQANLLAHWNFDQVITDTASDMSTNIFESADPSFQDGVLGSAVSLKGLGYINAGDRMKLDNASTLTLAAWVRPSVKEGRLTLVSRLHQGDKLFRGYAWQLLDGQPVFFLINTFPDDMIQVQAKQALEPNKWYHLAVSYDGSGKAKGVTLFVNGQPHEKGIVVDKLQGSITADRPFWIGEGQPSAKFKGQLDELRVYDRALQQQEIANLPGLSISSLLAIPPTDRNAEQARRIREHYLVEYAPPAWRQSFQQVQQREEELATARRDFPTVMVMSELEKTRPARILERGAYNRPGETVTPATPAVLPPMPTGFPANRLGLARWLVADNHPLTSRVIVNRIWQHHFGVGLVRTSEDFGIQGDRPSHPHLLDWLALRFIESGWDLKQLQRLILYSATYRQSSRVNPELLAADPDNRLLSRGPRYRLPAEVIRDQALSAAGLLSYQVGGSSVRPYQPAGLWREVAFDFSGNLTAQLYKVGSGEDLYRRSIYSYWKRNSPPPTLLLFDAPDRERCIVRRATTSTPLQALALMNDPTYVEAARKLSERIMRDATGPGERISLAFRLLTARRPNSQELELLLTAYRSQLARFGSDHDAASALLEIGESVPDSSLDPVELASYTMIASVILNLNETITRQ